jgi:hypothetical protein
MGSVLLPAGKGIPEAIGTGIPDLKASGKASA